MIIVKYLRMKQTPITRKLVSQRLARLLVNVFWIAMMIAAVKLHASLPSKMTTPNALVRFVKMLKTLSNILYGFFKILYRKIAHWDAHVTTTIAISQRRKRF